MSNREHFDRISSRYEKASQTWTVVYQQIEAIVSPLVVNKDILDIGNGGYFPYETTRAKSVTVLDISPEMLERMHTPNIHKVVGDARDLSVFKDNSFDNILYILCIHHINGSSFKESQKSLEQLLHAAQAKLKPGGQIIIAEPTVGGLWYLLERIFYILTHIVLGIFRVPMIFFHSKKTLETILDNLFTNRKTHSLKIEGWIDPLGGSFPGRIKIPAALCPTRYYLFQAQKPQ